MRRSQPVLIFVAAILVAAVAAVAAIAAEAIPGACNRNTAKAPSVQFTVATGSTVWQHIPRLGISPELDAITDPVTVVVFEGPHHAVPVFLAPREGDHVVPPFVFNNVVCVVAPSGEEMYYYDVDSTGLNLEGLAVDRRSE